MDFYEISHSGVFGKSVEKIKVLLKSDKNNGYFYMNNCAHLWHVAQLFFEWEMFETEVVEKNQNIHFMSNKHFSPRISRRVSDNVGK